MATSFVASTRFRLAGGEARKLLEHEADIESYSWSPDGAHIAFTATDKRPADEKELDDKGFNQQVYEEELHNGHVWIGEPSRADVWQAPAEKAKPKRFDVNGHASSVHWSPAGDHLAVSVAPTPLIDDAYMKQKIHTIKAADGSLVGIVDVPGKLGPFAFSPNGEQLALLAGATIHDPNPGRLMTAPLAGGAPVDRLPELSDGDVTAVAWRLQRRADVPLRQGGHFLAGHRQARRPGPEDADTLRRVRLLGALPFQRWLARRHHLRQSAASGGSLSAAAHRSLAAAADQQQSVARRRESRQAGSGHVQSSRRTRIARVAHPPTG